MTASPNRSASVLEGQRLAVAVAKALGADEAYVEDREDHLGPLEGPLCMVCWDLEADNFQVFQPHSDMNDTLELMGALRAQGRHVSIAANGPLRWLATVSEPDKGGGVTDPWPAQFQDVDELAPIALCHATLAALRASGRQG